MFRWLLDCFGVFSIIVLLFIVPLYYFDVLVPSVTLVDDTNTLECDFPFEDIPAYNLDEYFAFRQGIQAEVTALVNQAANGEITRVEFFKRLVEVEDRFYQRLIVTIADFNVLNTEYMAYLICVEASTMPLDQKSEILRTYHESLERFRDAQDFLLDEKFEMLLPDDDFWGDSV